METFNVNATSLTVEMTCVECGESFTATLDEMPMANFAADNASDSENSEENSFECTECGHSYRAVLYKNMDEGNVEIFDEDTDEEIKDFEISEEGFDEEDDEYDFLEEGNDDGEDFN